MAVPQITCIIPAAGYGTRMGLNFTEAKEMLIERGTGKPLICWAIDRALAANYKVVIVTRIRKLKLRKFLEKKYRNKLNYCLLTEEEIKNREWAYSVCKSKPFWSLTGNILLLPDTRFGPFSTIKELPTYLGVKNSLVFATHKVLEPHKFGVIHKNKTAEKPAEGTLQVARAWGLIAFSSEAGNNLFKHYQKKGKWLTLPKGTIEIELNYYKDLTRDREESKKNFLDFGG